MSDPVVSNLRFAGQYFDGETGLHYNYHRHYDPRAGRYLTADLIGFAGGINLFEYASGNPANVYDERGENPFIVIGVPVLIIITGMVATAIVVEQMRRHPDVIVWDPEKFRPNPDEWIPTTKVPDKTLPYEEKGPWQTCVENCKDEHCDQPGLKWACIAFKCVSFAIWEIITQNLMP